MSARLVSPHHVAALAAFAIKQNRANTIHRLRLSDELLEATPVGSAAKIAEILMAENVRSVDHRYPSNIDTERNKDVVRIATEVAARYVSDPAHFESLGRHGKALTALDIIKMADCLNYQSCETDDYQETAAAKLLMQIRENAITAIPGYDEAIRDFDEVMDDATDGVANAPGVKM